MKPTKREFFLEMKKIATSEKNGKFFIDKIEVFGNPCYGCYVPDESTLWEKDTGIRIWDKVKALLDSIGVNYQKKKYRCYYPQQDKTEYITEYHYCFTTADGYKVDIERHDGDCQQVNLCRLLA